MKILPRFVQWLGMFCVWCGVVHGEDASQKIRIGFIEGFTGDDPHTAAELWRGAELFFRNVPNAAAHIQLLQVDNHGSPETTYQVMEDLHQQGVNIAVGISKSDQAIVAASVATKNAMLFVTPFATNTRVTTDAPSTFRLCYTDDVQGTALAQFANAEFAPTRVLILQNVDVQYSIGLTQQFVTTWNQLRPGSTVQTLNYVSGDLGLANVHATVEQLRPQLVFIPDHITRSAILIKEIHSIDPNIVFLGGDGWGGKKVFQAVYPQQTANIRLFYSTHWHENIHTPENQQFVALYRKNYVGEPVTSGAALTYDTLSMVWRAVQTCQPSPTTACLTHAVEVGRFATTTGAVTFGPDHNPRKRLVIIRYTRDAGHSLYKMM